MVFQVSLKNVFCFYKIECFTNTLNFLLMLLSLFYFRRALDAVLCLGAQLYPPLCDPVDCRPPGSSVHGDSPGKNTGVGCHALLQKIFPSQESNPGLLHCKWILLPSEAPGKPKNTEVGSLSLLQGIFPMQESNHGLLHCRWILTSSTTREAHKDP